jgi:hypothetical protein
MAPWVPLIGVLLALGLGATACGRMCAAALHVQLLRRPTTESLAMSAFLGTGALILVFGWWSYAGCAAPWCLLGVAITFAALWGVLVCQGYSSPLSRRFRMQPWITLGTLCVLAVLCQTMPQLVTNSFVPFNDTFCYVSIAEWLQHYGFGSPCSPDPTQPLNAVIIEFQTGLRIGAMFLLALVEGVFSHFQAIDLIPIVMAWGVILNVLGVFVLCRWSMRIPNAFAIAVASLVAVTSNPLCFSSTNGFFCQVYGTASLSFGLAIISRLCSRVHWRTGNALLFGAAGSVLISVYSELAPVLFLVCCVYLIHGVWRARRASQTGKFLRFVAKALFFLAVLGNVEFWRAARTLPITIRVSGVGWHIPWATWEFFGFALGWKPFESTSALPLAVATVAAILLLVIGGWRAIGRPRALPVVFAGMVFAALFAYFHFTANDPWTSVVGHTWNQFKLCKWAFPTLAALEGAGLFALVGRLPIRQLSLAGLVVGAAFLALPVHLSRASNTRTLMQAVLGTHRVPYRLRELHERVDQLGAKRVYLLHDADTWHPDGLASYLLFPRPFVNGWRRTGSFGGATWMESDQPTVSSDGTLFLVACALPFEAAVEQLPYGLSVIDPRQPCVFRITNPNGLERAPDGGGFSWLGTQPITLHIWSLEDADVILAFDMQPGPSLPTTPERRLAIIKPNGHSEQLHIPDTTRLAVPISLAAGVNQVQLRCLDEPTVERLPNGDARPLLLLLSVVRVARCNDVVSFESAADVSAN